MKLLVGADPEVFAKLNGEYHSAHGLVKGTKNKPFPVQDGAVQVDGMALEFNIDPAEDEEEFIHNVDSVMAQLRAMVPEYEVVATPCAHFDQAHFDAQPVVAKDLGCDPDFNAWTQAENEKPVTDKPFRTGSGHVHLGWTKNAEGQAHLGMCADFVKQSDFYLGLPSLLFDNDVERRELYGKAGAYRPKSYGVEYRVLSNKWLADASLTRWVYRAAQACFNSMRGGMLAEKYGDIQHIINTSNVDAARQIIQAEGLIVPEGV